MIKLVLNVVLPLAMIGSAVLIKRSPRLNDHDKGVIGIIFIVFAIVMLGLIWI